MPELAVDLVLATATGGVGRHVRAVAAGLVDRGHRVRVLGPQGTEELFAFTGSGAEFIPVPIGAALHPARDARVIGALRRAFRADVVHAHGLRAAALCALARGDRPLVSTWHNAVLGRGPRAQLGHALERLAAHRATVTLAASHDLLHRARQCGARDARFAPVPAPPVPAARRLRSDVRAELGLADEPVVVSVTRLHPQKDLPTLVAAAARLAQSLPQVRVLVAGDGPERESLEELIARSGAPVTLLGHREDTADLLRAADAAVLTSRWEARSLAAQEALSLGVPLVATAVGGLPDLVGDAAVLVQAGSASGVAGALGRVLTDDSLRQRLARAAERQVSAWPNEVQMLDQLESVYVAVLAGGR